MLVAAVDAGSFSAAALELGCTQSRISHAIGELERIVGARLLERSRSGCVPTDAGYRVLVKARQMLRLAAGLAQSAGEEAVISGHVRIACFRSAGVHLLPHVLEALAESHPGIRVDVNDGCPDYEDIIAAVKQGMAEIGITREDTASGLESTRLGHDNYVLVLPAGLQTSDPFDWRLLAGLPFIQSQNAGSGWIVEHCRAAGLPLKAARRLASDSGITAMIARGLGFSLLPHLAVFPAPPGVRIAALPIEAERPIALVTTAETARSKPVRIVLRHLRDKAGLRRTDAYRAGAILLP
ncbi:MAG: LysR family transcriptional regulator [Burkholderiaceae bacterium]|nr:LysR family transcriptional regulator [Burkholderiaceae bacterium]